MRESVQAEVDLESCELRLWLPLPMLARVSTNASSSGDVRFEGGQGSLQLVSV